MDAVLADFERDLSRLAGNGMAGVVRNDKDYAGYVNYGTSEREGQHFLENSIPGIEEIAQEEFGKISGFPTTKEVLDASDRVLQRAVVEEIVPRTPRSLEDPKLHLQDAYEIELTRII